MVSDAEVARQILLTNAGNYSKGLLSEILDFVMGTGARSAAPAGLRALCPGAVRCSTRAVAPAGLIPADGEIWKSRRRAIVPSLHRKYIESMVAMFGDSALHGARTLQAAALARPAYICAAPTASKMCSPSLICVAFCSASKQAQQQPA